MKNRYDRMIALAILVGTVASGCASTYHAGYGVPREGSTTSILHRTANDESSLTRIAETIGSNATGTEIALLDGIETWMGTPYKFGGCTESGIDCSCYVQHLYAGLGIDIPRATFQQIEKGEEIAWNDVAFGDLLFFKTPSNHVGVYLGNGEFTHASSSRGVVVDILNEYWEDNFIGARRILDESRRPPEAERLISSGSGS